MIELTKETLDFYLGMSEWKRNHLLEYTPFWHRGAHDAFGWYLVTNRYDILNIKDRAENEGHIPVYPDTYLKALIDLRSKLSAPFRVDDYYSSTKAMDGVNMKIFSGYDSSGFVLNFQIEDDIEFKVTSPSVLESSLRLYDLGAEHYWRAGLKSLVDINIPMEIGSSSEGDCIISSDRFINKIFSGNLYFTDYRGMERVDGCLGMIHLLEGDYLVYYREPEVLKSLGTLVGGGTSGGSGWTYAKLSSVVTSVGSGGSGGASKVSLDSWAKSIGLDASLESKK